MAQFGSKNTPWVRPAGAQQLNPQIFTGQLGGMNAFAVSQAAAMGLGAAGLGALGGGVISTVNPAAFAQQQPAAALASAVGFPSAANAAVAAAVSRQQQVAQVVAQQQQQQKNQRTFIGIVTKLHENYGFVDDDVFFQTTVVRGGVARIGDRVMVEASFNANMPFKWNAVRIQLLPNQESVGVVQQPQQQTSSLRQSRDERWISDRRDAPLPPRRDRSPLPRRSPPPMRRSPPPSARRSSPSRRRSPSPGRHGSSIASGSAKRERSPAASPNREAGGRGSSRSPPRRRPRLTQSRSYSVTPKFPFDTHNFGVFEIRKSFSSLYVPSDFFHCQYQWTKCLPLHHPLSLDHSASYHVLNKEVDCLDGVDAVLEPPDADYRYSAKVMLLSLPGMQEIFKQTIGLDEHGYLKTDFNPVHLHSVINFLVGTKNKTESLAVGGPWSPSLDGPNPEDPNVMVRCAIRTTKALTGIDLSKCTQWYKFLEIRYRRADKAGQQQKANCSTATTTDGQQQPIDAPVASDPSPRIDTVIIFLPDVWRVMPSQLEFEGVHCLLKSQLDSKIANLYEPLPATPPPSQPAPVGSSSDDAKDATVQCDPTRSENIDESLVASADGAATGDAESQLTAITPAKQEAEDEEKETDGSGPTHWSRLDIKSMKVNELRLELVSREIDSKGVKSQLVARLMKAVKAEQEAEELGKKSSEEDPKMDTVIDEVADDVKPPDVDQGAQVVDMETSDQKNPEAPIDSTAQAEVGADAPKSKMRDEKEIKEAKAHLERAYEFRANKPGILVYPSRTAKGGKFDCRTMSLNSLLDYRPEDNKEHSFEVFLFAEAFCQMLMRDNGFKIFKSLIATPDPAEKVEKPNGEKNASVDPKLSESEKDKPAEQATDKETPKDGDNKEDKKDVAKSGAASNHAGKKDKHKDGGKRRSRSRSLVRDDKKSVKPTDPSLLQAFLYFDKDYNGCIGGKDLDDILLALDLHLTRSQMLKLTKKVISRDALNYRKLTDVVFLKETKEKISEPSFVSLPSDEELAIGNAPLLTRQPEGAATEAVSIPASSKAAETIDISSVDTVLYNGTLVNVGQILSQIEKLEREAKSMEHRLSTLDKDLSGYKDEKRSLERRKRRLEDDYKDARKRLYDAEKCLKNSQDDTVQLKTALHRCKEYSESIARLVDKTLPSKREKETSSERSEKGGKSKSGAATTEKEEAKESTGLDANNEIGDTSVDSSMVNAQGFDETKLGGGDLTAEEQSPAPDEELAVREEVTESDRPETDLNVSAASSGDNTQV